ncbi:MAG: pyrogallol hydroxytransferase large subunit [Chloroflexi bacterium RBG_16_50_9]|nr:MAG: pyrogallol hydroxytransferase large subunit [Chloroflexi bacterium RBG_16_50_9]
MLSPQQSEQIFTNCTTGGPVQVYVKNGRITRIEPLQFSDDDAASWVIPARGRRFTPPRKAAVSPYTLSERSRTYASSRILHPLKRVDFDPGKNRNPGQRGKSGYMPVSWEEALDILAGEIKRINQTFGPGAILTTTSSHHNWGNIGYRFSAYYRFMSILGAIFAEHNPDSWEGWLWGATHHWGYAWRLGIPEQYDLLEDALKNTELIVFWSADPNATSGIYNGHESTIRRFWLKELGVKMVFIDPYYNFTAMNFADKWLAPRPGTDAALAAAIAYVWIDENLLDKDYIEKCTTGFDKWRDYILGHDDGSPKTPAWAEEESGIPAREIRALARDWARKKTMLAAGGVGGWGGACRAAYATEWTRMMVLLMAMRGMGKPGINLWSTTQGVPFNAGFYFPGYAEGGISGEPVNTAALGQLILRGMVPHPVRSTVNDAGGAHLPRVLVPECIMNPPQEWRGKGFCGASTETQFKKYKYPEDGFSRVKMFWRYGGSYIGTMNNTNRWVKMYQSPNLEFVVNQSVYMEGEAQFADLVLPACSNYERSDIGEWANPGGYGVHKSSGCNHRIIVLQKKCIEPLGESKPDYEIFAMVARKLGFYDRFTDGGLTEMDWVKRMYTASDLPKYISWEEFEKKGYFIVPIPKDYKPTPALRWFAEGRKKDTPDPGPVGGVIQGLPDKEGTLATQTGKIEFEAQSLQRFDPNDEERPPVPRYIPSWEGHHTRELYEKYPLQLITPHPHYSFHTMHDAKDSWINEIPEHRVKAKDGHDYWVIRINPQDAETRGIKDGDLVRAYNDRGTVILAAQITERVRPGVVHSYESCAVYEPTGEPGESPDKGGCINILTPHRFISTNACGMAPNSCLIEIARLE